jgi:hypothetical protein
MKSSLTALPQAPPQHGEPARDTLTHGALGRLHAAALALGAASTYGAGAAQPDARRAALATERYYSSYGAAAAHPDARRAALAAERYYSSYGTPEPLRAPAAVAPAEHSGGPSWSAAIFAGLLVSIAAAGAGVLVGRSSGRQRHASA